MEIESIEVSAWCVMGSALLVRAGFGRILPVSRKDWIIEALGVCCQQVFRIIVAMRGKFDVRANQKRIY